jgi:sorbitol/mannitol transport system permease protein
MSALKSPYRSFWRAVTTIVVVVLCLAYFFPIFYMILTSFKTEADTVPPKLFFTPTLENYQTIFTSDIARHIVNSFVITTSATILCVVLGVPAAYALVFGRLKKPDSLYFWFLSTLILPAVSVIVPVFLVYKVLGLLDSHWGLIWIYVGANVPIVVWMVRAYLKDLPPELLEAAEIDGASRLRAFSRIVLPLTRSGILSTALLVFIFVWNEFFFAVSLTYTNASTIPVYMASFMTQEGFFWAKLSAISTVTVLPPLILGWLSHKSLVQGLMMGAVKG